MFTPFRLKNPFTFPGDRLPGFDPTHPAAQGIAGDHGISCVASGRNVVSLLGGAPPTVSNSPTLSIFNGIGQGVNYSASNMVSRFNGQSTANDLSFTMAAICVFNSVAAQQILFASSSLAAGGGWGMGIGIASAGDAHLNIAAFGVNNTGETTITVVANTPYFLVASYAPGNGQFLALNLNNGAIQTGTSAVSMTPTAPNGSYLVGNRPGGSNSALGIIAAVMFAPNFLAMSELKTWAQDPWAFWYPPDVEQIIGLSLPAPITIVPLPPGLGPYLNTDWPVPMGPQMPPNLGTWTQSPNQPFPFTLMPQIVT